MHAEFGALNRSLPSTALEDPLVTQQTPHPIPNANEHMVQTG